MCLEFLQVLGCTWGTADGCLLHFQAATLLPRLSVGLVMPQPPLLPPHPGFPEPLSWGCWCCFPSLLPALVAAAKFSEELLSILILIGPFLIMMFSQQFQPITVSRGD